MVGNSLIELSGSIKSGGEKWNQLNDKKELAAMETTNYKFRVLKKIEKIFQLTSISIVPSLFCVMLPLTTDFWLPFLFSNSSAQNYISIFISNSRRSTRVLSARVM